MALFRIGLRIWRSDLPILGVVGIVVMLAIWVYLGALNTVQTLEQTAYSPARRLLGGDCAIALKGSAFSVFRDSDGRIWSKMGFPGHMALDVLPPEEYAYTLVVPALAKETGDSLPLLGRSDEFSSGRLRPEIVDGRYLQPSDQGSNSMVFSTGHPMYAEGKLAPGSTVHVLIPVGQEGDAQEFREVEFQVIGLYRDPFSAAPIVPLAALQRLIDAPSAVTFAGFSGRDPEVVLAGLPGGFTVISARDVITGLTREAENVHKLAVFISGVMAFLATLSLGACLLYLLSYRRRDMCLLLASGLHPAALAVLFGLELTVTALLSSVAGVSAYYLSCAMAGQPHSLGHTAPAILGMVGLAAVLPALAVALSAYRLSPLEVFRNE